MRSDRLKQVMQQIDPNFDERNAGFNRFSKFVTEAANRGLIQLTKLENGQYEISGAGASPAKVTRPPARSAAAERSTSAERSAEPGREERGTSRRRGRRGRGREREREGAVAEAAPAEAAAPRPATGLTLARAFQLMTEALAELRGPATHEQLRSRMVAMLGKEDELLDPERFPRLLRQANDAEIADVRSAGENEYEISLHRRPSYRTAETASPAASEGNGAAAPEPAPEPAPSSTRRGVRFRRGSRAPSRPVDVPLVGVVSMTGKTDKTDKTDKTVEADKSVEAVEVTGKASKASKAAGTRHAAPKAKKAAKTTKATKSAKASKPRTRSRKAATTKAAAGAAPPNEAAS
jgi:hypothetical protein